MRHWATSKTIGLTATLLVMIAVHIMFAGDSSVSADCKYQFSKTKECAPIQSLSIDRIDFEIVASDRSYSDGTVHPSCAGRLYIEGGNVRQFADLNLPISVYFGSGLSFGTSHVMQPSTLRPGTLEKSKWIVGYRDGYFVNYNNYGEPSAASWVSFDKNHQTIPVGLSFTHDRYGWVGYDAVQVPVPNSLLGFDAALVQCRKELLARDDTKVQDFVHRQNIATAEAKIAGAKARKAYYESQMAPLQAQIEELQAIIPSVLAALEDAAEAHQRLLDRKAEYAKLMEEFALAESEHYARLFTAVETAQKAISISVANVEQSRIQIQSNVDGINSMIAEINADIEEASNSLMEAERDLQTLASP